MNIIVFYEDTSRVVGKSIVQVLNSIRNKSNIENLEEFSILDLSNDKRRNTIKHLLSISYRECLIISIGYSTNATVDLLLNIWMGFQDLSVRYVCITYSFREKERLENTSLFGQSGYNIFKDILGHTALNVNSPSFVRDIIYEIQELKDKPSELLNSDDFKVMAKKSEAFRFLDSGNVSKKDLQNLSYLNWDITLGDHAKAGQARGLITELINEKELRSDDTRLDQLRNLIRTAQIYRFTL